MQHLYRAPTWHPRPKRRGVPPASGAAVLAGLDLHLSVHQFGQRTGVLLADVGVAATISLNVAVFADAWPLVAPLFTYTETTNGSGQLTRKTHASLVAGTWYWVWADNPSGGLFRGGVKRIQAT